MGRTILVDLKALYRRGHAAGLVPLSGCAHAAVDAALSRAAADIMQAFASHNFDVVGELQPGVSIAQATAELEHHPAADSPAESGRTSE